MAIDVRSSLNRALKSLHVDRARIDRQIDAVVSAISALGGAAGRVGKATARKKGRRKMNAAQKKAVSVRMRAYWAKRRASK